MPLGKAVIGQSGGPTAVINKSLIGFIKEAMKLKSGSKEPGRNIIGTISKQQLKDIAEKKMEDLNAHDLDEAAKIIAGSARSMGIEVKD